MKEMRRQQAELQTRLREETQKKEELEQQIVHDQRRIRELEIKLKVQGGEKWRQRKRGREEKGTEGNKKGKS